MTAPDVEVAIVGAGFSGIGAAIKLDEAGFRDWVCSRTATASAGRGTGTPTPASASTSRPSATSSPSSSARDWSRVYARGGELKAYAEHCVD